MKENEKPLIDEDIEFVKSILPNHYTVKESKKKGSIHCVSPKGIHKSPYTVNIRDEAFDGYRSKKITVKDAEDEEHWKYIFQAIKQHFGERFMEVFHNVCHLNKDFTIYLRTEPKPNS